MSKLEEIKSRMAAITAKQEELRKQAEEEGKTAFADACKILFEENPTLEAFKWTQYTPYFCDGDPCEFSANEVYVRTKGMDDDAGDYEDGFDSGYRDDDPLTPITKACQEVRDMLDKDTLEALFGDHVEVVVTPDGVETSECSHD